MSICQACATVPPVTSDYTPKGTTITVDDFEVYETGNVKSENTIVVIYDIFGFHNVTKKFVDVLGEVGNYRVLMPDCFRGKPWDVNDMPPKEGFGALMGWIKTAGSYENTGPIVEKTIAFAAQSAKNVGLIGFCWGAAIAVYYSQKFTTVSGISLIHPSLIQMGGSSEDGVKIQAPALVITTKDDPDYSGFVTGAKNKFEQTTHKHFSEMSHGFAASRGGDYKDPIIAQRVREALQLNVCFFDSVFKK